MNYTLRPLNPETDFPQLVELLNAVVPHFTFTVEEMQRQNANRPEGTISHRTVAFAENGRLIGYCNTRRNPWSPPGEFYGQVMVHPEARNQGVGRGLADDAMHFLTEQKANRLVSEVREDAPAAIHFADSRDFQRHLHLFQSKLDLTTFDETPFVGALEKAEASGIRFFSIADIGGPTEENMRKLYDLECVVGRDIPGREEDEADMPFAEYFKFLTTAKWFRPEGQIVAADGDRWVGMAAIANHESDDEGGQMYHNVTGVLREYRGRSIASALKVLDVRCARKLGVRYLRTNNASNNAPMLAINRKMGYQPEPGFFVIIKKLA